LITSAISPENIANNWAPDLICGDTWLPTPPGPPGLPGIGDNLLNAFATDFCALDALADLDLRGAIFIIFYFLQDIFLLQRVYINVANV
jgi:hypothetical protein